MERSSVYRLFEAHQYNLRAPLFSSAYAVYTQLYQTARWSSSKAHSSSTYGSVYNIEFSPVSDLALAVYSHRAVLCYDPRLDSSRPVHTLLNAHDDAVNCLTFLDPLSFATCSDDKTIRVWDLRQLKSSVAVMQGHKNWVKNIEYDKQSGRMFSVALYDGVREWDMNKMCDYTNEHCDNLVFKMTDPVRMKLSPNGSKMFISERDNVCTVISQFNGETLRKDASRILKDLRKDIFNTDTHKRIEQLSHNKPSVFEMTGQRTKSSYRAIMSASFFPCGDFIALRHMDLDGQRFQCEHLSLFDLRQDVYTPKYSARECQSKYLKYSDESSPLESLDIIKEISVSKDGRVIASPHKEGVRLLAVDQQATPPDLFFDDRYRSLFKRACAIDLHTLHTLSTGHRRAVLACKFASHDLLLATGCLGGQVVFHKPYF